MNAVAYNNLHPDVKPVFDRLVGVYRERQILGWNVQDFYGVQKALENGVEFIDLDDAEIARWQAALGSVTEDYVSRTVATGFSEAEVRSWIKYIQDRSAYWTAKQAEYGIVSAVGPPEVRPEYWIMK